MIAILTDVTKCIGCFQCVEACVRINKLGPEGTPISQDSADSLSATRWTTILRQPDGRYVRKQCRHCLEPACVSVCPVGAMIKTAPGPVIYDTSRCMGCRYCMMACPYGIPRYEWDSAVPYVRKCNLCYERVQAGQLPACTEGCSQQATIFGPREELLAEARRRLEVEPNKYVQKIYGEHEVGGASVMYISDVPLELGFRGYPGQEPMPRLTEVWLNQVPAISLGLTAVMAGTYWIIKRRMQLTATRAEVNGPGSAETTTKPAEKDPSDG
ncbi:MAG: 4Fe-4S dicluster domain-containing protein [Chloroflexota bacterium]